MKEKGAKSRDIQDRYPWATLVFYKDGEGVLKLDYFDLDISYTRMKPMELPKDFPSNDLQWSIVAQ